MVPRGTAKRSVCVARGTFGTCQSGRARREGHLQDMRTPTLDIRQHALSLDPPMFLATCPYLEMDETWSSRLRGCRARSAPARTRRVRVMGNCGAGVVDGTCGAVGRVAWVGIGTPSVPIPTHIRCVATPVPRKTPSGHQR